MGSPFRRVAGASFLACLAGLAAGREARGQQVFSTYTGPDNGAWSTPGNWDNLTVPNGSGSVALVPGPRIARLNLSVTLDKYGVGGVIRVQNGVVLGVYTQTDNMGVTGIFGGGTTSLESTGTGTYLRLYGAAGSYAIHGNSGNPSFIQLSNTTANVIDGTAAGIIFYNQGTIQGSGQIGANVLDINNSGSMIAQYPGGSLIIDPSSGGLSNSGLLMSQGGTLVLQSGTFTNTGVGSVNIQGGTGGTVTITGSRVVGGTLQGTAIPGEAFTCLNGSVLQDVRVAGEVRVPNGHVLHLDHGLEIAGGGLYLNSAGTGTYLRTLSDTTLFGVAGIELSNTTANVFDASAAGQTLTNNLAGGIRGAGQIGVNSLSIINNTNIYASGSAGLYIDPAGSTPFINNGHLHALTGSTLALINGTFDNGGQWWIEVQPNATCYIDSAAILGGNLNSAQPNGIFYVRSNSVLDSVTLTPSTIASTPNGHLIYLTGTINNQGTYNLASTGTGTYLRALANYQLTGGGTLFCSNTLSNVIDASVSGQVLTVQNQTIRGSCQLGANTLAVVNNSLIEAQGSQGMVIDSPGSSPFDNNAVVRALTGSYVDITGSLFDNSGGLIEIQDGAGGYLSGSTLQNGTVRTLGSGTFFIRSNSTFQNVTFDANCATNTPNGHLVYVTGSINNQGTYNLASTGTGTYLRAVANYQLTGGGTLFCSNTLANVIDASVSGQVLTVQNQTIRGSCQLGANTLAVVNNSLIEAQGSQGMVIDSPGSSPFDNNAVVRALTGSYVDITGSLFDNSGGLIEIQDGAGGYLSGSTLQDGTVRTLGSGTFFIRSNSTFQNVTFDANCATNTPNGHLVYASGSSITNRGTYAMASVGTGTYLRFAAPSVTWNGGGVISCSDTTANVFDATTTGYTLILDNQTVRGSCQLGANTLAVLNNGTIIADASHAIVIDPPAASGGFVNGPSGVMIAQGAGGISIGDGPFQTSGIVQANAGRLINRTSGTWEQTGGVVIANGEIQVVGNVYSLQAGVLTGTGLVDSNVTNAGGTVSPGQSPGLLTIEGAYTQQAGGSLLIEIGGPVAGVSFDRLSVTSSASLNGTLTAYRVDGYTPNIGDTFDVLVANSRVGTFVDVQAPEFSVTYTPTSVRLTYTGSVCDPDYTQDGNADQDDVAYLINAIGGGGNPNGRDLDFNLDGNSDQDDILALVNLIAGGGCP